MQGQRRRRHPAHGDRLTVAGVSALFDFDDGARAGLFAGSQTNTPALSAALEQLAPEIQSGEVTDPVVGYSLAYPLGVLTMIAAAGLLAASAAAPLTARRANRRPRPLDRAT